MNPNPATETAAPPASTAYPPLLPAAASRVLTRDERIIVVIKPSLWMVWLEGIAVWGACLLLGLLASSGVPFLRWADAFPVVSNVLFVLGLVQIGWSTLRWASCVYLVTNTRVLQICGVIGPNWQVTLLSDVERVEVRGARARVWPEVGAVDLHGRKDQLETSLRWVKRPDEVASVISHAIRAQRRFDHANH